MKDIFDEQIETMRDKFEDILNIAYKIHTSFWRLIQIRKDVLIIGMK